MKRLLPMLIIGIVAGCGQGTVSKPDDLTEQSLPEVQKATSEILDKSPGDMLPDSTFAMLGADELDVVEITMLLEDKLGITISDAQLAQVAGVSQNEKLAHQLTLRDFARVVASAPKYTKRTPQETVADGNLREAQVGTYSELSKMPNPKGHELIFVPSLDMLQQIDEQRLSRKLTSEEIADLKSKAIVIALSKEMAENMRKKQKER